MNSLPATEAETLSAKIKTAVQELGFDLVGISPVQLPPHGESFARWLRDGHPLRVAVTRHDRRACLRLHDAVDRDRAVAALLELTLHGADGFRVGFVLRTGRHRDSLGRVRLEACDPHGPLLAGRRSRPTGRPRSLLRFRALARAVRGSAPARARHDRLTHGGGLRLQEQRIERHTCSQQEETAESRTSLPWRH